MHWRKDSEVSRILKLLSYLWVLCCPAHPAASFLSSDPFKRKKEPWDVSTRVYIRQLTYGTVITQRTSTKGQREFTPRFASTDIRTWPSQCGSRWLLFGTPPTPPLGCNNPVTRLSTQAVTQWENVSSQALSNKDLNVPMRSLVKFLSERKCNNLSYVKSKMLL